MNANKGLDLDSLEKICKYLTLAEKVEFILANDELDKNGSELLHKKEIIVRDMDLSDKQFSKLIRVNSEILKKIKLSVIVSQERIIPALIRCVNLTEIQASSCGLTSEQLILIANSLIKLEVLNISANANLRREAVMLTTLMPSLRKLIMYKLDCVDDNILHECTELEEIDIGKTKVTEIGLLEFAHATEKLTVLGIEELFLSWQAMDELVRILEETQRRVTIISDKHSRTKFVSLFDLEFVTVEEES